MSKKRKLLYGAILLALVISLIGTLDFTYPFSQYAVEPPRLTGSFQISTPESGTEISGNSLTLEVLNPENLPVRLRRILIIDSKLFSTMGVFTSSGPQSSGPQSINLTNVDLKRIAIIWEATQSDEIIQPGESLSLNLDISIYDYPRPTIVQIRILGDFYVNRFLGEDFDGTVEENLELTLVK